MNYLLIRWIKAFVCLTAKQLSLFRFLKHTDIRWTPYMRVKQRTCCEGSNLIVLLVRACHYKVTCSWIFVSDRTVCYISTSFTIGWTCYTLYKLYCRHWYYSPIGAREWGNKESTYLGKDPCWKLCLDSDRRSPGDVISYDGHVAIVTGQRLTTSANSEEVVETDWGFRSYQDPTCWRYAC